MIGAETRAASMSLVEGRQAGFTFRLRFADAALAFGDCPTANPPMVPTPDVSRRRRACLGPRRDKGSTVVLTETDAPLGPQIFYFEMTGSQNATQLRTSLDRSCAVGQPPDLEAMNLAMQGSVVVTHAPQALPPQ